MMCEQAGQIHAYHDGELAAAQQATVESHLSNCADCRELLEDLRAMSSLLITVPLPMTPQSAMNRMQGSWWANKHAQDMGIRKLAGWLTAVAAAILVLVPMMSGTAGPDSSEERITATVENTLAFIPPAQPSDGPNGDLLQVTQWMANDLSTEAAQ